MPGDIKVRVRWSVPLPDVEDAPEHVGTMTIRPRSNFVWFVSDGGTYQTLVSRQLLRQATIHVDDALDGDVLQDWLDRGFRPLSYGGRLLTYDKIEEKAHG